MKTDDCLSKFKLFTELNRKIRDLVTKAGDIVNHIFCSFMPAAILNLPLQRFSNKKQLLRRYKNFEDKVNLVSDCLLSYMWANLPYSVL